MKQNILRTDVLCVGGGIVGLMAAIRASESGASVTIVEKGNTLSSGKGGMGNDHFLCYIPEVHGTDLNAFIESMMETQQATNFQGLGMSRVRAHLTQSFDIVKLWDHWGIPMKYNGKYEFAGHAFPGGFLCLLKYEGRSQKLILTQQAKKRGIQIIDRVMITDLTANEKITGAIGISTRKDEMLVFNAKSVILGTGGVTRLYPGPTPGIINNYQFPMTLTADGRVLAYHAGAELQDLERYRLHVGPKYFARSGQATWIGVYRDARGNPIGPFVTKPERLYGDITPEVSKAIFADYIKSGRGPVFMDGKGMSDEDYAYMQHWMVHEGLTSLLNHMKEEGIDIRKNPVEFMTYSMGGEGKIRVDKDCNTSIPGLYAAGDEVANGISNAAIFGWIAGENAAKYIKEADSIEEKGNKSPEIEKRTQLIQLLRNRTSGASWREANLALQYIMTDYAGQSRSGSMLESGLNHLRRLREKTMKTLAVFSQHDLERSLEVLNLFDLGELIFVAALERKETRPTINRSDYPLTNPRLNKKTLVVNKLDDKPHTEWQGIKP